MTELEKADMTPTLVRLPPGHAASVVVVLCVAFALAGCSTPAAAPDAGPSAGPASTDLTVDGLFAELATIECEAYESGVYNQNEIWGAYATVAGRYEESGLIDSTEIEVPGAAGTISTISLRTILTSEDELRDNANVGEGLTTRRADVGDAEFDVQASLLCTVFSNNGTIPQGFADGNGLKR